MPKIAIIGSGFSGISAAAYLAASGYEVHVYERNESAGGRARQFSTNEGYVFDMGPSWYWMPEIFEEFFNDFNLKAEDFYDLKKLDPAFEIVFENKQKMKIPADIGELHEIFEELEAGSSLKLRKFMKEAQFKYETGMKSLFKMPGLSFTEFFDFTLMKGAMRLQIFSSFSKHLRKYFSHPKILALMEFPVLFLGATAKKTPALYSLMNYAGLKLGTWYPTGGFGKVVESMKAVAEQNGSTFHFNSIVSKIIVEDKEAKAIVMNGESLDFDAVIASGDYHHIEEQLLDKDYRNYNNAYWKEKIFAPSCLIYYVGVKKKIPNIQHHTLFFEEDLTLHSDEIYKNPKWPSKPLFYVCCPSQTDHTVAPFGHENLFFLMPLAPGLEDNEELREKYFKIMISRLESYVNEELSACIDYKKSYCVNDFIEDYNSYKGNAYGLANTLMQTAVLKPKIKNKKVKNLFYAGQLTVPGPGVPPSIISGKLAADQISKYIKNKKNEAVI